MPICIDTENLTVTYTTKKVPSIESTFLLSAKNMILKKQYGLSIHCVGKITMKRINTEYKHIQKSTDILSFPIDETMGEIYLCFDMIEKKANMFNISKKEYTEYVIVHGMIHLLGHDHGDVMDKLEQKYTKRLHILYPYRYT